MSTPAKPAEEEAEIERRRRLMMDREKPIEVCKATGRGNRSGPSIHGAAESPGKDTRSPEEETVASGVHSSDVEMELREEED